MSQTDSYYLGIVGAANKSSAALAREDGTIITSILDAPPLLIAVNIDVRNNLEKTVIRVAELAGLAMYSLAKKLRGVCVAMSGVYTHRDRLALMNLMDQIGLVGDFHRVVSEDANAHLAANFLDTGGVVIASTGSNVFIGARGMQEALRVDGWGSDIGDDGGGYDLGRKCLRALFKAEDGRYPGSNILKDLVLKHTGVSTLDALIEWFYRSRSTVRWRSDIADLAIPLIEAAEDNNLDPLAYWLVSEGANDLFNAFETANRRIQHEKGAVEDQRRNALRAFQPVPLILEGGLFENSSIYRRRFLNGIHALNPCLVRWRPVTPAYRPVVGALALAISARPFLTEEQPASFDTLRMSAEDKDLSIKSHPLKEISDAWTD